MNGFVKSVVRTVANVIPLQAKLDEVKARKILQDFSPKPSESCATNNRIDIAYGLQIIVTAYNIIRP